MNIERREFLRILKRYRKGKASPEEEEFLHAYYNLFEANEDGFTYLDDSAKETLKSDIQNKLKSNIAIEGKAKNESNRFYIRWASAAAFFALVVLGAYLYEKQLSADPYYSGSRSTTTPQRTQDIAPGKSKAILTLADGSDIQLDASGNGMIAMQAGSSVKKINKGELVYERMELAQMSSKVVYNTISIPRGGEYRLTLPDGSKVWLNSASSIRFPTVFSKTERRVEITGEVYFEVSKDQKKPFQVVTAHQIIEVLGTHFNVNAYEDENVTKTTLLEGSVKVSHRSIGRLLKPGQQSLVTGGGMNSGIKVVTADLESAVAWKNGYFEFRRTDIQSIMRQVSRWYNVDVEFRGEIPQDEFVGKIKRNSNVSGVLRILKLSDVNCWVEGRKIIIQN